MNYIYSLLYKNLNTSGCFADEKHFYSYKDINGLIINLANKIKAYGVKPRMKIAILLDDKPMDFVIAFFAIAYLDCIPVPIYTKSGDNKIINIINYYEIDFAIGYLREFDEKWEVYNLNSHSLIKTNNLEVTKINSQTILMLFTSGTTSIPKGIMLSEGNLENNIIGISHYLNVNKTDKTFLVKNLNHSSTIVGELLMSVYNGIEIYFTNKIYTPKNLAKVVKDNKITILFAVPTIIKSILAGEYIDSYKSLKKLNFYGGKLGSEDIKRLCSTLSNCEIIYSYGLTEASPRVTYMIMDKDLNHLGSSGIPIDNVSVSIMKDNILCSPKEIGEIIVEGSNVMLGYYKNEEKTRMTIIDNKLHTGDLGYLDEDGFLYVIGRKDNMCIYAGKNVYLDEIEAVLLQAPNVLEALVVPIKKDNEIISFKGYIVADKNKYNYREVINYCMKNIDIYKVPKEIVLINQFEKTASGKIKRKQSFMEED